MALGTPDLLPQIIKYLQNTPLPPTPIPGVCCNDGKMTITVFTKATYYLPKLTPFLPTTSNGGITGVCSPSLNNLENTLRKFHLKSGENA